MAAAPDGEGTPLPFVGSKHMRVEIGALCLGVCEAWVLPGTVGRTVFWEQRYWLMYMGVTKTGAWQKQEKRRQVLPKLQKAFGLQDAYHLSAARGDRGSAHVQDQTLCSCIMMPWLAYRWATLGSGPQSSLAARLVNLIRGWCETASMGLRHLPPNSAHVTVYVPWQRTVILVMVNDQPCLLGWEAVVESLGKTGLA